MGAPASVQTEINVAAAATSAAAADLVARSVLVQELPEVVAEAAVLERVATVIRAARLSEVAS